MRKALPFALPMAMLVSSCGSGSGGSPAPTPTPPPAANQAPSFTSAATASTVENAAGAVYQATATDPDGNALSYSIAGGADAAAFTITSTGALSFATPPNFDANADADGDNVYRVQLRVSDASLSATLDVAVTVTNSREGIAVKRIATGLNQPIQVAAIPGSTDVFVIEKGGAIYRMIPATGAKTLLTTVAGLTTDGERGLLGIAAQPDFATSGVFVTYSTGAAGTINISRYTSNPATGAITGGPTTLLSIPHASANNHNGGWLGFGPDGLLYLGTGDGGGAGDPNNNAQNVNSRLGKILRLQLSAAGTVSFPASNPYAAGGGDPAIYAIGMRNPFRNSFDGNRLIIADVGQDKIEEIDTLSITDPGRNFGWPYKEGTATYRDTPPAGLVLTDPVSQYDHGSGPRQGNSIIGGYVYNGPVTSLRGSYVFADYVSKNIWSVPATRLVAGSVLASSQYERRNLDFTPDTGTIDLLVSFGVDNAGNLYLVDIDGDLFEVVPG